LSIFMTLKQMVPFIFLFGALGATAMEAPDKGDQNPPKRSFDEMNASQPPIPLTPPASGNESSKRARLESEEAGSEIVTPSLISLLSPEIL
jgi:hypothetical protein